MSQPTAPFPSDWLESEPFDWAYVHEQRCDNCDSVLPWEECYRSGLPGIDKPLAVAACCGREYRLWPATYQVISEEVAP